MKWPILRLLGRPTIRKTRNHMDRKADGHSNGDTEHRETGNSDKYIDRWRSRNRWTDIQTDRRRLPWYFGQTEKGPLTNASLLPIFTSLASLPTGSQLLMSCVGSLMYVLVILWSLIIIAFKKLNCIFKFINQGGRVNWCRLDCCSTVQKCVSISQLDFF